MTPHSMRHAFATKILESTGDLAVVQRDEVSGTGESAVDHGPGAKDYIPGLDVAIFGPIIVVLSSNDVAGGGILNDNAKIITPIIGESRSSNAPVSGLTYRFFVKVSRTLFKYVTAAAPVSSPAKAAPPSPAATTSG